MKILSIIPDGLLHADNVLIEMTIGEYLNIGHTILDKNPYQRKRVERSTTIYSMLNNDLQRLCVIPTITLAFYDVNNNVTRIENISNANIGETLQTTPLIILDGLQRTYTLLDVENALRPTLFGDEYDIKGFLNHRIRVELYNGLSKTGVLYRMLTLNTGQSPMSKRHEIEILYAGFLERPIDGISFNRQASLEHDKGIDVYDFDDAIEGYTSFIDSDESVIDRMRLLSAIQRMEKLVNNDYERDMFERFIRLYNAFVHRVDDLSNHWVFNPDSDSTIKSIYGRDIPGIFNKSQTMSAFGAAVGQILWDRKERGMDGVDEAILGVRFTYTPEVTMNRLLCAMQTVRNTAKKIGIAQRLFLKLFFLNLFDVSSDSFQNMEMSISNAIKQYEDGSRL